jgi:nucleoid DNA-binding protein
MNKSQLLAQIVEDSNITKVSPGRALDSLIDSIISKLASDGDVALVEIDTY